MVDISVGQRKYGPARYDPLLPGICGKCHCIALSFDDAALHDLASSIKQHGIIQPLVLRKVGNKYEIIAGERRYKASFIAGLTKVPAIVIDLNDNESAEVAIVENIQRKNLSAIEEARSYKNLLLGSWRASYVDIRFF